MIILDGGMGRELERMGAPFKQPEWSALALMEAPHTVEQAHTNFINAGAEVIISNSYAVIPYHIGQERFDAEGDKLIKIAADQAQSAVSKSGKDIKIAGSIPPLFGSYQPDKFIPQQADILIKPFIEQQKDLVDFWIVETITSLLEAKTVWNNLEKTGKPIWLAFNIAGNDNIGAPALLRTGETMQDIMQFVLQLNQLPQAVLFNCSRPERITQAIQEIAELIKKHDADILYGGYANSFVCNKKEDGANRVLTKLREDLTPEAYLEVAEEWKTLGAQIIGGCCGIGPEHIDLLAKNLK